MPTKEIKATDNTTLNNDQDVRDTQDRLNKLIDYFDWYAVTLCNDREILEGMAYRMHYLDRGMKEISEQMDTLDVKKELAYIECEIEDLMPKMANPMVEDIRRNLNSDTIKSLRFIFDELTKMTRVCNIRKALVFFRESKKWLKTISCDKIYIDSILNVWHKISAEFIAMAQRENIRFLLSFKVESEHMLHLYEKEMKDNPRRVGNKNILNFTSSSHLKLMIMEKYYDVGVEYYVTLRDIRDILSPMGGFNQYRYFAQLLGIGCKRERSDPYYFYRTNEYRIKQEIEEVFDKMDRNVEERCSHNISNDSIKIAIKDAQEKIKTLISKEYNFWQSKSKVLTGKTNATDAQIITAVGTVGVMSAAGCIAVGVLKETIISKSGPAAFLAPIALLSVASVFFLTFAIAAASMLLLHYNDYKKQDQPSTQIENQSTEQAAETEKVIA